jgi:hypothetical protein
VASQAGGWVLGFLRQVDSVDRPQSVERSVVARTVVRSGVPTEIKPRSITGIIRVRKGLIVGASLNYCGNRANSLLI